jgi:hypothetical protein
MYKLVLKVSALLIVAFGCLQYVRGVSEVKQLYIPNDVRNEPGGMCDTSEYSMLRMKETQNLAIFWSKKFGMDPMVNPDSMLRFDVDYILKEGERIYNYYVNDLKFIKKGQSISDKYKLLIFIVDSKDATAYGGGNDDKIGAFWAPPVRMRKAPFGALAHEMGHSFQYMLGVDRAAANQKGGMGSYGFVEMTSQYMLWHVYPEWMTFENYHLIDFMKQTNLAFMHPKNMYHSPYLMEYWANKHGEEIISKIWQESLPGEDPVVTYKRLTGINQTQFNDEIFDAARRFITWDMKRIEKVAKPYANQHFSKLDSVGAGWYRIALDKCPQNYGYNGIKLLVPAARTTVKLDFKGLAGAEGFNAVKTELAGWRYGFLAVKSNGNRVYGKVFSDANVVADFVVPKDTKFLWLVVSGAPTEHWVKGRGDNKDEQWPYQIRLTGTSLDVSAMK